MEQSFGKTNHTDGKWWGRKGREVQWLNDSWELQLFHLCHFWKLYKYSLESIDVCGKYESAMFPRVLLSRILDFCVMALLSFMWIFANCCCHHLVCLYNIYSTAFSSPSLVKSRQKQFKALTLWVCMWAVVVSPRVGEVYCKLGCAFYRARVQWSVGKPLMHQVWHVLRKIMHHSSLNKGKFHFVPNRW